MVLLCDIEFTSHLDLEASSSIENSPFRGFYNLVGMFAVGFVVKTISDNYFNYGYILG